MRAVDAWAIEEAGIPSLELMERAGEGLARSVAAVAGAGPIRVVAGRGNNGGDGLVAARLLRAEGREVDVLAAGNLDELGGDARVNLERLDGEPPRALGPGALGGSAAIVDAVLGTGAGGAPREEAARAIFAINAAGARVVACDVPSGVDASTGEVETEAVRATVTATFHAPKVGLAVDPGREHAGEVRSIPIGVPRGAPEASGVGSISSRVLALVPRRSRGATKFSSGSVVVAGGARGLTGAPCMAALAAMRAGAGYVQLAVPVSSEPAFELRLLEAMTRGLPDSDGAHTPEGVEGVVELAGRAGAVVLGPGLGRSTGAVAFARGVASAVEAPLLIDADGLNAHAGALESLASRSAPTVLTPHAGELGRLLDRDPEAIGASRLRSAREAAERSGAVVVLKGDDTIVAAPGGPVAVSPGASPALATAGTGDVLSGVIGTLLAKGLEPFVAAAAGVLAHGRAGIVAGGRIGADHTIASDVIEALGPAFTIAEDLPSAPSPRGRG